MTSRRPHNSSWIPEKGCATGPLRKKFTFHSNMLKIFLMVRTVYFDISKYPVVRSAYHHILTSCVVYTEGISKVLAHCRQEDLVEALPRFDLG